jgi:hypothetical protein
MPPDNKENKTPTFAEEKMSNEDLAKAVRDLRNELAATRAGMPLTLTPEHAAGPGMDFAETWSQYEQEQAIADTA